MPHLRNFGQVLLAPLGTGVQQEIANANAGRVKKTPQTRDDLLLLDVLPVNGDATLRKALLDSVRKQRRQHQESDDDTEAQAERCPFADDHTTILA
jgi:hypothetical protein